MNQGLETVKNRIISIDCAYHYVEDFVDREIGIVNGLWRIMPDYNLPNTFLLGGRCCSTNTMHPDHVFVDHARWSTGINLDMRNA